MNIKNLYIFSSILFIGTSGIADAAVDYINVDSADLMVFYDTVISDSVTVSNMNIMNSANITNNGTIKGFVGVCYGCDVRIENSGSMDVVFDIPNSSRVVQLVHDNSDLNSIGATGNFEILVETAERLSWANLRDISTWADKIILNNSSLEINGADNEVAIDTVTPNIELQGNVILYIDDVFAFSGIPVLSNVSGNGNLSIYTENMNPLYKYDSYILNDEVYVEVSRETDYLKVLGNDRGAFLNELRDIKPNDKLLKYLDAASSMTEIEDVLSKSVRFAPMNLMNSVRVLNSFEINDLSNSSDGISVSPFYVFTDEQDISGINVNVGYELYKKIWAGITVYAAKTEFLNDIDEYEASLYGGNVHIAYIDNVFLARMMVGMTNSEFDIGPVFNEGNTIVDPEGKSSYSVADLGFNFDVNKKIKISPFLRVGFDSIEIADLINKETITGAGADILLDAETYDINYKYGLNFSAYTNGQINAAFKIDVNSIADKAGGNIEVGLLHDEFGNNSYKVSVGINFKF